MSAPQVSFASSPEAAERTVSMRVVSALLDLLEQLGVSRRELMQAAALTQEQLDAPEARAPETEMARICELVLELSGDPALGLHWGERLTVDTFAPVSYLVAHADNLGQALQSMAQFDSLMSDEPGYAIVESEQHVSLRCNLRGSSARMRRFMAEVAVSSFIHIVRCFHAQWRPDQVCFEYAAPAYRDEYARVFEHAERFDQSFTGICFERSLLATASRHRDAGIHQALQELAQQRLSRLAQRAPYAQRVRDQLVQQGRLSQCDMTSVASALGLSVRSLRRRLASEGKTYAQLEAEAFAVMARRLLLDQALTIQQTAYALGFSGTTTFHRAFKRAMGTTPNAFREAQLGARRG